MADQPITHVLGDLDRETKYLRFTESVIFGKKTRRWAIYSVNHGDQLGYIAWYGPWRQYAVFVLDGTIWNQGCLDDITSFLAATMRDWRAAKKMTKAAASG